MCRIGDPRGVGKPRRFDHWEYRPGGDGLTAQIEAALSIAEPGGPFAAYVQTLDYSKLMIVTKTADSQSFIISHDSIVRLEALGSIVDGDLYWVERPPKLEEPEMTALARLSYSVDDVQVAEDPEAPFEFTDRHFETRVTAFARRIAREFDAPAPGSTSRFGIQLTDRGLWQGNCWLGFDRETITALAALDADVVVSLQYRPEQLSSRA